jgi:hypothetical protein
MLKIENLNATVGGKPILKGANHSPGHDIYWVEHHDA